MNTIGIDHNLDRARIRKLLVIGLFASVLTGIGDFLLGYGESTAGDSFAASVMASAPNLADRQMIAGGLLGFFGIFLEGLSCFAVYRLMADAAPKYAHLYRAGIFGYIWLAPVGCHLNMGVLNLAYKYLLRADEALAAKIADLLFYGFSLPIYLLLVIFWLPMMIIQFMAFAKGLTPYPKKAKWFCVPIGAVPALLLAVILGPNTALGAGIGTMFLSFGNAFMFGGLLATMPSAEQFTTFESPPAPVFGGMKQMVVQKTSVFPAGRDFVFQKLQQLETLQMIAKPYATFEAIGETVSTWEVGSTSAYRFRLFGVIPFGTHTIHIVRFDPDGVSSREGNEHVPVWNHDIQLIEKDETHTQYTDRVEIHAGWKTVFIWLWANAFYAHRQRKWIRLLKREEA